MSRTIPAAIAAITLVLLGTAAQAQNAEHAVRARQGILQNFAWHFGPLVAMARGDLAYDAERAAFHAEMLQGLPPYLPGLFIEGSSNAERSDTAALPVIWSDNAGFLERYNTLVAEIGQLAAVAADGQPALAAQAARTAEACSGCHRNFRAR